MHKKILGVFLFLLAAWGIWYVTSLSITPTANGPYLEVTGENTQKSDLFFELDTISVSYPGGAEETHDVSVPYVLVDGEKVYPFGDDKYIWVRGHDRSYDENFLYLGKGAGPSDAGVQAYVFDIEARELHMVEEQGGATIGFASEDLVLVWWEDDGRMYIEYDNPGLASGALESSPAIGAQRYVSVSSETPWVVEVWE